VASFANRVFLRATEITIIQNPGEEVLSRRPSWQAGEPVHAEPAAQGREETSTAARQQPHGGEAHGQVTKIRETIWRAVVGGWREALPPAIADSFGGKESFEAENAVIRREVKESNEGTDPSRNESLVNGVLCPRSLQTKSLCEEWCKDNSPCTKKSCPEVQASIPDDLGICLCTAKSDLDKGNLAMCRLDNSTGPIRPEHNATHPLPRTSPPENNTHSISSPSNTSVEDGGVQAAHLTGFVYMVGLGCAGLQHGWLS